MPTAFSALGLALGFGGVFVLGGEVSGNLAGTVLFIAAAGSDTLGAVLVARWFGGIPQGP